ncbi:MAG: class IV adenylate cyclase [Salibacteraceae bacterium]
MKEVEVKILDIDREEIEKKLVALGAEKTFEGEMTAIYWDFPDKSLRANKRTFRLRQEGDTTKLTFKTRVKHQHMKVNREEEVTISDFETMQYIFRSIGLRTNLRTVKDRVSYQYKDIKFEIDDYTGNFGYIPVFLEIEGENEEAVEKIVKKLGYTMNDCKPFSTNDLILHYRNTL